MMKRIAFIVLTLILLIPGAAMAHSKLESAVPAVNATVEVSPTTIEMSFDTKVESLSNFKLLNAAGDQIKTGKAEVEGSTMKGSIDTPLENGTYTVKWTIIGADGHSVGGDYSFTVEATATTEPSPETTDNAASPAPSATPTPSPSAQPEQTEAPVVESADDNGSGVNPIFIIGGLIIVAAVIMMVLRRRK